jgi:glucosyl-3-phosphoglycerate synthase
LPFRGGYGVDLGLLIDTYRGVGLAGIAQVDLHRRRHRNAELPALGRMAAEVLHTALDRLAAAGRLSRADAISGQLWQPSRLEGGLAVTRHDIDVSELPPLAS